MKLVIHQEFREHAPAEVAAAYADPGLYDAMEDLPFVGAPSVLAHEVDREISRLAVRWAVRVQLPAAARLFVDESKLSFVEHVSVGHDGVTSFHVEPDHYRRLLSFGGTAGIEPGPDRGCRRTVAGVLRVDLGWKGRLLEADVTRVIASGLSDALQSQVCAVERYLA